MATIEQNPVQQRIPRSRSARLADQAATAALYVTHPERSLSLRQPPSESDPAASKAAGFGIRLSDASAAAALIAHAKKQEPGLRHTASVSQAADRRKTESPAHEGYPYQAAMYAIKDQKPAATFNRKRADSAPTEAARASASARASIVATEGASDPFEDLDKSMRASRIQNAHLNRKLFTATPPVAPELEEHRRKSILGAASISMARDMYAAMEAKESGLQRSSTTRSRRSGSASQRESTALQQASTLMLSQAINLQGVAEKRAAEKLAGLEDKDAAYRSYYGIEPQATRSNLTIRRRRGSNETEQFDQERSKEIRTQMSTLRSKLNAVDEKRNEKRENDRALLLELARKNVDAAIQDMDKRLYSGEAGQSVALQKYLDEKAAERARKGIQDIDAQYMLANKVNIGGRKYVEMSDVEDLARSRLQPTLDEIDDIAESQRARDLEARLDAEQRQRLAAIEREREADIRAEQERHQELLKQDQKTKEEKAWPWKRKSRQLTPESETDVTTEQPTEQRANGAVAPAEATQSQLEETASQDSAQKRESKFKNWFKDRLGRRSSGPSKETNEAHESAQDISGPIRVETEEPERTRTPQEPDTSRPATASTQVQRAEEPGSDQDQSRAAPLRSNPITAEDLNRRAESVSDDTWKTPSESLTTEADSKETSKNSKQQPRKEGSVHELPAPSIEKVKEEEEFRDAEPLPAPPSMESVVNKRRSSVNSTVRESRFSEDL
ncbi:hypothetical protein BDW74DRAFT_161738 [Aspergillus multicolor]|uniref:uncharacterized protein n=1 Tax=Aspergillus multicolor TaxID=41759 RepID=UPI003CCCE555